MPKITTIGWWNGQSNLLLAFNKYLWDNFKIKSIVSMSDDGRTTWELIRNFKKYFDIHLPPLWDLRKCFYSSSKSKYIIYFKNIFENIFSSKKTIESLTLRDLLKLATIEFFQNMWKKIKSEYSTASIQVDSNLPLEIENDIKDFLYNDTGNLKKYLEKYLWDFLDLNLPLPNQIRWHKFWNIFMSLIYYHNRDFNKMILFMHDFLKIKFEIIPVTIEKAFIKAILKNWEIIETQDHISNNAEYTSKIVDISLMDCSKNARQNHEVQKAIINSEYLIIAPGDLFTSTISNFIIGWVKKSIKKSKAKIILIWNTTNKWWETAGFKIIDFIKQIEKYLWQKIDYFITNDEKICLTGSKLENFKNNISVQWWNFLYLTIERKTKNRS